MRKTEATLRPGNFNLRSLTIKHKRSQTNMSIQCFWLLSLSSLNQTLNRQIHYIMADRRRQEDAAAAAAALPSLFYVKHHNDEVIILNSKCPTAVLQDRLRKLAGADLLLPQPGAGNGPNSNASALPPPSTTANTAAAIVDSNANPFSTSSRDAAGSATTSSTATINVDLILAGSSTDSSSSSSGGGGGGGSKTSTKGTADPVGLSDKLEQNGQAIYANTFIASRATYVLLAYTEDEDGVRSYKPIWRCVTNHGDEADRLQAILDSKTAEEKKKVGTKKGGKK